MGGTARDHDANVTADTIRPVQISAPSLRADDAALELNKLSSREAATVGRDAALPEEEIKVRSKIRLFAIVTALYSTLFVTALNTTIVATNIPTICRDLNSSAGFAWIGGAHVLALAAAGPIWAKLSDIWGRKPIFLAGVALYFVASIICATSTEMGMLIAGRALQGTAGGGVSQMVSIVLSDLFSVRKRALYFGFQQAIWAVAGGVGPVLGGAFAQYASWRWTFWINLPISGIAFTLLLLSLDVHNPRTRLVDGIKAIDWIGILCLVAFVVTLLLGLNFGGVTFPWQSPTVLCLIVFGVVLMVMFVLGELRFAQFPLMPMSIFKSKSNAACLIVAFVHNAAVVSTEYYLPLYFQSVKGASPVRSGVLILAITITEAVVGILSGVMIHRTGRYLEIIWTGVLLLTLGIGLYIRFDPSTSISSIIVCEVVAGIGAGLLFDPPIIALQAGVTQDDTATATATLGFLRSIATAIAVITGGILFQNSMLIRQKDLREAGLPAAVIQILSGDSAVANVNEIARITSPEQKMAVMDTFAWSLRNIWIMCTCLVFCGVIATTFIRRHELSNEHVETKTGIKK